MGRRNKRGLELSFKPLRGSRGRGRWHKKVGGQNHYFGWGDGVTDREGYQTALAVYRGWVESQKAARTHAVAVGLTQRLQAEFSVLDEDAGRLNLVDARRQIDRLHQAGGSAADLFAGLADGEEKRRLIVSLESLPLHQVRQAFTAEPGGKKPKTTGEMLDEFLEIQRARMDRRLKLDKLRESGSKVQEAAKQNLSAGRFAAIARDVAAMRKSVGSDVWDETEASAARVVRKFRDESDALVLAGKHSPHTFNDRIKVARMLCAWAESTYQLDRLPRDRSLFAKYPTSGSTAKAIPLDTLRTLWAASDDRGRCWLLLGLNCAYYAKDISDLTAEMVEGTHLSHNRGKTGVRVRYKLWKRTREYLKKLSPKSGRVFTTTNGTPLVHHSKLKKSGEPVRVDNVRNWFFRLCGEAEVEGFSFSNVRDTASTEVERIDRSMTDLFLAHRDPRMAALYVDGDMIDSEPLDRVIEVLEKRLSIWLPREPKAAAKAKV